MKPKKLKAGDKIAIVSLSSGMLGDENNKINLDLGIKRLKEFGLKPVFMKNTLKGSDFIKSHPENRAEDLIEALSNKEIKGIICAIGGQDTYLTLPFLMRNEKFKKIVKNNPKIFIGYSDSTINHLMFYKLGLNTFYGHSFLVDFAELDKKMLPYSENSFKWLFDNSKSKEIVSSSFWYLERTDFSLKSLNTPRIKQKENKGYEVLYGKGIITGKLFGGCLESLYEMYSGERFFDQKMICEKYKVIPNPKNWKNKIVFLETSEEKPVPTQFKKMIRALEDQNVFKLAKAILIGKPQDESFYDEYKKIMIEIGKKYNLPVMFNLNFGHSHPKTILPYNCKVKVNFDLKKIHVCEKIVK